MTISLINPAHLSHVGLAADDARVVTLQNPLAADRSVLRPTLLLGLLESIQTNVRRQMPDVRLFEIGRVYESQGAGKLALEETRVAIAVTGSGPRGAGSPGRPAATRTTSRAPWRPSSRRWAAATSPWTWPTRRTWKRAGARPSWSPAPRSA